MSHWQCDSKEKNKDKTKKGCLHLTAVNNLLCNLAEVGLFQPTLIGHDSTINQLPLN